MGDPRARPSPLARSSVWTAGLLCLGSTAPAQQSILWSLSTGSVFPGASPTTSVRSLGDVNGDGAADIAVGSGLSWTGFSGQVAAFSGIDGNVLWTVSGTAAGDRFGGSMATVGDLDGDGVADLVVGASQAGFPPVGAGYVGAVSGATGATLFTANGVAMGDAFGAFVDGTGDVNGDAIDDFVVGAAAYSRIVSGSNGATLRTLSSGSTVAGVGDADGDGVPDVAVGSPLGSGIVRLYSGASGGLLWSVSGAGPFDAFGTRVAGPGDVDGDGFGDVIAAAMPNLSPHYVSMLSGAGGALLYSMNISGTNVDLARAGDVNGDGVPDFLVGAPVSDIAPGSAWLLSGANGTTLFFIIEPAYAPYYDSIFARSVAVSPDIDGDGAVELFLAKSHGVSVVTTGPLPPGTSLFGSCSTLFLFWTPFLRTMGGPPMTGSASFTVVTSGSPYPPSLAVLAVGLSPLASPLNVPTVTCPLSISPDILLPMTTNTAGAASVPLPIPSSPALVGAVVYFQWYTASGVAPTPGKLSLGLQVTVL